MRRCGGEVPITSGNSVEAVGQQVQAIAASEGLVSVTLSSTRTLFGGHHSRSPVYLCSPSNFRTSLRDYVRLAKKS